MRPRVTFDRESGNGRSAQTDGAEDAQSEQSLETELKLAGSPAALDSLWTSTLAPHVKAETQHLISTYFDTSDFRLRTRGFSFRVRQEGDRFVQTIKAENGWKQGVMSRGEWSADIDGPMPDLTKIGDQALRERIGLIVEGELQSLFTTDIQRQARRYRTGGRTAHRAYLEAAYDCGEIRTNGSSEPISEIELELLEGSTVALRTEAIRLHQASPLQFQPRSKAARGFAFALGEHPPAKKADLPELSPGMSVEEALQDIFANCMSHWLANHAAVLDGSDTEGVHQMRVGLRRLRSALTLFKALLPADDFNWLQGQARALIGGLGSARDWDVFIDELLHPVVAAREGDSELELLQDAVDEERRRAYEQARATISSPAYLQFILDLGIWLETQGWRRRNSQVHLDQNLIEFASEVLSKRHKQALKLGHDFDDLSDAALHRLRISLKKLRYATEFFSDLYEEDQTRPYVKALKNLQDDLGHLNDVAVAETRLRDLCGRNGSSNLGALQTAFGAVIGWHSHVLAQTRPRIAEDWVAFKDTQAFWDETGTGI